MTVLSSENKQHNITSIKEEKWKRKKKQKKKKSFQSSISRIRVLNLSLLGSLKLTKNYGSCQA